MAGYREPGTYSKATVIQSPVVGEVEMYPLIIGTGVKIMKTTVPIVRGTTGKTDTLPKTALSILCIGDKKNVAKYSASNDPSDYTFSANSDTITWNELSSNIPASGATYYVTFTYEVDDTQFEPHIIRTEDDLVAFQGSDFLENEGDGSQINRLYVAIQCVREANGGLPVYAIQVKPDDSTGLVGAPQYKTALNNYAQFVESAYRIVPTEITSEIAALIDSHVEDCSSYEERKERTAIYGAPSTIAATTFSDVLDKVGGYAESKKYKRVIIPYPDSATKMLSDGNYYELDSAFICAAIAGTEHRMPISTSLTRASFNVFNTLKGVKMNRKEMNLLAEKGIMILTQVNGAGTPITIRHQLTTDSSSVENRENSIVRIVDYASKKIRAACDIYIGPYNITGETIALIRAAFNDSVASMVKDKILISGSCTSAEQDEANPDCVLLGGRLSVPYPCNYIDIDLLVTSEE